MLQGEFQIAYPGPGFKSFRRHKWENSAQRAVYEDRSRS
jgi:hypothetical protein